MTNVADLRKRVDIGGFSSEALVDAIIRLTHRVHTYDAAGMDDAADNCRAQRDLARAELLKRCGGAL